MSVLPIKKQKLERTEPQTSKGVVAEHSHPKSLRVRMPADNRLSSAEAQMTNSDVLTENPLPDVFEAKFAEIVKEGMDWQVEYGPVLLPKGILSQQIKIKNSKSATKIVDTFVLRRAKEISREAFVSALSGVPSSKAGTKG